MSLWRKTPILLLLTSISLQAETGYFCQQYQSLLSTCIACTAQKNCDASHQINCPKLELYAHKCTTEKQTAESNTNSNQTDNSTPNTETAPASPDTEKDNQQPTSPFKKRWQSIENDLNVVIPDKPIPAPGMKNKPGNPSTETLKKPSPNFILKSWY